MARCSRSYAQDSLLALADASPPCPVHARRRLATLGLTLVALGVIACSTDDAETSVAPEGDEHLLTNDTSTETTGSHSAAQSETSSHTNASTTSHAASPSETPATTSSEGPKPSSDESTATEEEVDSTSPSTADTSSTHGASTFEPATSTSVETSTHDGSTTNASTSDDSTTPVQAANICNEDVPEDRYVDGIPAYTQCADSEAVAIWSNDGVSTSFTQEDEWRRTQWDGGYQCTEFANRYLFFVWGVSRVPNGDAGTWCDEEPPEGLVQSLLPAHGDLIVFAPGSCGASEETGHVAVVDTVDEDNARVVIVEQNRAGRRATDIECAACFLHAVSNDAL